MLALAWTNQLRGRASQLQERPTVADRLIARTAWFFGLILLPWFLLIDALQMFEWFVPGHGDTLAIDAHIYYRGAAAWLAGANPWAQFAITRWGTTVYPAHFTGLPPTIVAIAPWTILPEQAVAAAWLVISIASALYIIRRLRLPLVYLFFPPLVEGVLAANPHVALVALALSSRPLLAAIAPLVKLYMVVPLVGERDWRALSLAAVGFGATVLLANDLWRGYLSQAAMIAPRLLVESLGGYSAYGNAPLLAVTLTALVIIGLTDIRTAGWLAVPAAWPATQWFYATLALPVVTPIMAFFLALPVRGMAPVVVICVAVAMVPKALANVRAFVGERGRAPAVATTAD